MSDMYRVMVVDDEPIVRKAIADQIAWSKYQISVVKTAAHAVEALDYLRENDVELMLVDVRLPVMDGLELIRQVKQINDLLPCQIQQMPDQDGILIGLRTN